MDNSEKRLIERRARALRAEEAINALPPIPDSAAWLKPYCYQEWKAWPLTAPFTTSGHTWAVGDHLMLRMPVNPDVPVYEPGASHENEYLAERLRLRPQGGAGIERLWAVAFREVAMRPAILPIDGVDLTVESVPLINKLPGLKVETAPDPEHGFLSFRFDNGEGIAYKFTRPQVTRPHRMDDDEEPF